MIKMLKGLLGKIWHESPVKRPAPIAAPRRPNSGGDFRAVKIEPGIKCCAAAMRARESSYLLRDAPRVPLYGCTMPTNCSCKFRKNADRRDSDRRLLRAAETNRLFAGLESRKRGRRSAGNAT
jgi:hypothetical protein